MHTLRQRILAPFRTLGWKLTLSYTLVTVAALLVVELALMITGMAIIQQPGFFPRIAAQTLIDSAYLAAPFLDETPPDLNGLESWLLNVAVNGVPAEGTSGEEGQFTPGIIAQGDSQIFVVGLQRELLAMVPAEGNPNDWPQTEQVIGVALSGVTDVNQLFALDETNHLAIAAPIMSEGRVLGVLVYTGTMIESTGSLFNQLPPLLAMSALIFTITAGAVGTIFGLITSRGLVRRLRAVSKAADAWSGGDFSIAIFDRGTDELGQLAVRLNNMSEQLKTLLQTRQELASLEERNRLARDLHDSVKQQVFATVMQVGAARELMTTNPASAETHLAEAERLARLAQQELTVLIRELRPAALEGRGLAAALRDYLTNWSQQSGVQFELRVQGERALPLTAEQALYRVIQEALSNIARHSRATQVDIHLAWLDSRLHLSIEDNGSGFSPESNANHGVGLHSMRERVEGLNGTLTIESSPRGTKILIDCPV